MYPQKFPSLEEKEKLETDLTTKGTCIYKTALKQRSAFAAAADCIKNNNNKKKQNKTPLLV